MRIAFFYLILAGVVALSWWRGRSDERCAAGICVVGTLLTVATSPPAIERLDVFSPVEFAIDLMVLFAFVALALRSDRYWPLWVAALQLTSTTVHLLKFIQPQLLDFVVGAAIAVWSYPILFAIGVGALRTGTVLRWRHERELREPA